MKAHPALSHSLNVLFNIYLKNERTECDPSQFGRFFKIFKKLVLLFLLFFYFFLPFSIFF